jgi:hypothetical protein
VTHLTPVPNPAKDEEAFRRRLLDLLARIDRHEVALEIDPRPFKDWWNAYPTYKADGWTLCVFDDCYEWDYLEWAESPEGERMGYSFGEGNPWRDRVPESQERLAMYYPEHEEDWGYDRQ